MSKSELKDEKKKRKRQEDGADEVQKKVKKSKKSKDPAADEAAVVPEKKEKKKDKKSKRSKKPTDHAATKPAGDSAPEANGTAPEKSRQEDFIRFDDEPMPDAVNGTMNGALSRKDSKKSKKGKKSKNSKDADADATEQQPAEGEGEVDEAMDTSVAKQKKKSKKDKKAKKAEKSQEAAPEVAQEEDDQTSGSPAANGTADEAPANPAVGDEINGKATKSKQDKKEKKKSKKEKKASEAAEASAEEPPASEANTTAAPENENDTEANVEEEGTDQNAEGQNGEASGNRFIAFVGNLPYSATKEQIETHFEKLKPFTIRMRTYKGDNKFMGTCFIEFERFDHMRTALKKYHHSVFPDAKRKDGRKINVELSAGGGGNNPDRMQKIKAKNEKLANERQRTHEKRDEIETKQKDRKAKKEAKQGKGDAEADAGEAEAEEASDAHNGMHPARLAMMQSGPPKWNRNSRQRF